MPTRRFASVVLFLLAFGTAGCGSSSDGATEAQVYRVRGKLLGTTADGRSIVVVHEPIEAADMGSMTMTLRLRDTTALEGLHTGAKIAFDFVVGGALYAEDLTLLPPGTKLHLRPDTTAADSL